ncbi:MAG TPA: hypothetical protein DC011_04250 [Bacteroidetes bacterium]|nr:hypothetical protein [Bacteroidota bacterium]
MSLKTSLFFLLAFVFSGCASSSYVMKETAVNATLVPLELGNSGNQTYTLAANGVFSEQWESYVAGSFNAEAPEAMELEVILLSVAINENIADPNDGTLKTGTTEFTSAIVTVQVNAEYAGERFSDQFEITKSKYKEKQTSGYGGAPSPFDSNDLDALRVSLIKDAIEKSVVEVDKALTAFMSVAKG